jgi:hypothetical protein
MGRDGHLELQSKNVKKINDISTWLDAFIAYCSIYLTAHSNFAQGLLKHMFNVKLASRMSMGLAWKNYDQQLRMKKIARPFHVMGKCGIKWRERIYSSCVPV